MTIKDQYASIRIVARLLLFVMVYAIAGCAWFGQENLDKPAYELIQDGVEAFDEGQYRQAIRNFEQLKDWYPFSKYAILAELKIADAHYHLKEYPEAVLSYEEFEQLHPRNEAIPYVIYQIGRCYYEQIDTIDRDQTPAQKALETFQRLVQQHPASPYAKRSTSHIIKCQQSLSGHDFYVGQFYYKAQRYDAALHRFRMLITQYPDVGEHYKALLYIANCEALLKEKQAEEKAQP